MTNIEYFKKQALTNCTRYTTQELKEIDDYRFSKRYNSRSQATLDLIRLGLEAIKEQSKDEEFSVNS